MEIIRSILRLYYRPAQAMSELMDTGNWLFLAAAILLVSICFFGTVNSKLDAEYRIASFDEYYSPRSDEMPWDGSAERDRFDKAADKYAEAMAARPKVPVVGDRFFQFFTIDPGSWYSPLLLISVFYLPAVILLTSIFGGASSFGLSLRRDYGTLAICTLSAWIAAHLPFAVTGLVLYSFPVDPRVYLAMWAASGLVFGLFMIFALRTVLGTSYQVAVSVVAVAWLSLSLGTVVSHYVSPWLLSPFLLFWVVIYLGGYVGGEVRGFGNAIRQRQNLKRFLHNATVNPKDADAHVQLGLIYLQRNQGERAVEHFRTALAIDPDEIDANYEIGRIERAKGDLQTALDHFAVVVGQNDKHALSEIWREIGATYLKAKMYNEAREALEKYAERRSADVEGLYYLGKVLQAQGETARAAEIFTEAVASAAGSPSYHRRRARHWRKLAQKEL